MLGRRALLVGVATSAAGAADASELPPDLVAAARAYDAAQIGADRAALERLVAEDYAVVGSDGSVQNKAQFIDSFTAPGFRLEPFEIEDPLMRVHGDMAVLSGRARLRGQSNGAAWTSHVRFADVWARTGPGWQVVFAQTTRVSGAL